MQYEIESGGRLRRTIVRRVNGKFIIDLDGRKWTVDVARLDAQSLSLLVEDDGRLRPESSGEPRTPPAADPGNEGQTHSYDVTVVPEGVPGRYAVTVGAASVAVSLNGRRRWGRKADGQHTGGGPQRIVAPMPGKIVRVLVKPGEVVRARQPVLVIEAMKMENELRAGRDGIVAELHIREGQSVEAGGLLAVIAGHVR